MFYELDDMSQKAVYSFKKIILIPDKYVFC